MKDNKIYKILQNKQIQNYIYLNFNLNQENQPKHKIQKNFQIKLEEFKIHKECVKILKDKQIKQKYNYQLIKLKNQFKENKIKLKVILI